MLCRDWQVPWFLVLRKLSSLEFISPPYSNELMAAADFNWFVSDLDDEIFMLRDAVPNATSHFSERTVCQPPGVLPYHNFQLTSHLQKETWNASWSPWVDLRLVTLEVVALKMWQPFEGETNVNGVGRFHFIYFRTYLYNYLPTQNTILASAELLSDSRSLATRVALTEISRGKSVLQGNSF